MISVSSLVIANGIAGVNRPQLITGRNEVLAKVIFLHVSVILFTGGGGVCSKFSGGVSAPNLGGGFSNFQNTVNVRPVRILLECILVIYQFG